MEEKENKNNSEKKEILRLSLAIVFVTLFVLLLLFVYYSNEKAKTNQYGYDIPPDNSLVEYTDVYELISELKANEETQYFLLSRSSCPWCKEYIPYINEYAYKNNITIKLFDPSPYKGYTLTEEGEFNFNYNEYKVMVDFISESPQLEALNLLQKYTVHSPSGNVEQEVLWLYVPYLYKVENGVVVDVLKTPEDHVKDSNGKLPLMTEKQSLLFRYYIIDFFD